MAAEPMFAHELNGVQGFTPGAAWVVEKVAEGDLSVTDVTASNFVAGRIVHLNSDGQFSIGGALGTLSAGVLEALPPHYILFNSGEDNDTLVDNPNFNTQYSAFTTTIGQSGTGPNLHGFALAQAAELQTTEFAGVVGDYAVGTALGCTDPAGTAVASSGLIAPISTLTGNSATAALACLGFVTAVPEANEFGVDMLTFQSAFFPANYA